MSNKILARPYDVEFCVDVDVQDGWSTTWDATGATTPTDSTDDPWGRWDSAATTANGVDH